MKSGGLSFVVNQGLKMALGDELKAIDLISRGKVKESLQSIEKKREEGKFEEEILKDVKDDGFEEYDIDIEKEGEAIHEYLTKLESIETSQ